jgi:hypothetical protein
MGVAEDIAAAIESLGASAPPKLVVVKSTVPVGTSHRVRDVIASKTKRPFFIANNPEFLKEGVAIADFTKPDRVICGVDDPAAGDMMRDLYEPFVRQGNPIYIMDVRSSEMVKYASNAMLACKISFINEMANLCELYGADIASVREGMCADHRIGKQFLYPGLGYGGSCFPKDTLAVVNMGRAIEVGHVFKLGTKYSEKLGAQFLDETGRQVPAVMGCYGIGVTRTLQAVLEQSNDKDGVVWPISVAPYAVCITPLTVAPESEVMKLAERIYIELTAQGVEVILDDRTERPGIKFKDSELVGFPIRVGIGEKSLAKGEVEIKPRQGGLMPVKVEEAVSTLAALADAMRKALCP